MGLLATAVLAFIIRKVEKYNDDNAQTMIENLHKTQAKVWKRGLPHVQKQKLKSIAWLEKNDPVFKQED